MKSKFLLVILIFSFYSFTLYADESKSYWNYVYLNYFDELFDQSEIIKSESYKNASLEERERMLESRFASKKLQLTIEEARISIGGILVAMLGLVAANRYQLFSKLPIPHIDSVKFAATSLSGTFLGIALFQQPLYAASNWITTKISGIYTILYQYFSGLSSDELESWERKYLRKKPLLSMSIQKSIEKTLRDARTNSGGGYFGTSPAVLAPKLIAAALNLPRGFKELQYNRDQFNEVFDCYSDVTKEKLRKLVIRYIAEETDERTTQKFAVYFRGSPGTGKTRAAKLLAEYLEVPFREISLAGVTKESFVGSQTPPNPGIIANAMIESNKEGKGVQNFLLLVDEADRIMNSQESKEMTGLPNYMLMFLDPSRPYYYNEFFNAYVLINHILKVLAGNFAVEDEALKNRLDIIEFDAISPTCKEKIVWKQYFPELFTKYQKSKFKLQPEDFTEEDRVKFKKKIEADKDPGMRSIYRELEAYIADLVIEKIESRIATNGTSPVLTVN